MLLASSLIFFGSWLSYSCSGSPPTEISILWEEEKAVGLILSGDLAENREMADFTFHLGGAESSPAILGELSLADEGYLFTPLIPFTRGQRYEVRYQGLTIGSVVVPSLSAEEAGLEVLAIYPSLGQLPENQLKFYIQFSKPMREGQSGAWATLLDSKGDTVKGAFLDLQPELWNEDQTLLTLWLDPGRIKRDLIPNQKIGAPLQEGQSYQLVLSEAWPGKNGGNLLRRHVKDFVANARDSTSPKPDTWNLDIPKAETLGSLTIDFREALDYSLLQEVFAIKRPEEALIPGNWTLGPEEKSIRFTPEKPWQKGVHLLEIESRLEDLAGNNLNRPFETDLLNPVRTEKETELKQLHFEIKD
ncbi:hypothetical protein J0A68_14880 [Algoriphagus sp. H41]|uniref:SbsA Ig-like domain-containing protein n=1 Tax=Algoriphagus oliviformis TaxID=2811231 RepID=A0ABS3C7V1_9BACT|nr:Ig-like domain-containing protein [Algoriphagus oliviformis]MBN7812236.1 hypothetical protein [Algoriphagus oliviformis]